MKQKKRILNRAGQFEPFKLLIGAVLGLLILVLVLGVIESVRTTQWQLSQGRFNDGFEIALKTPTGDRVIREKMLFRKGTIFSGIGLVHGTPVDPLCVFFYENDGRVETSNTSAFSKATVLADMQVDVEFMCQSNQCATGNKTRCTVTFGRP